MNPTNNTEETVSLRSVADLRPTDTALERLWPAAERTAALGAIIADDNVVQLRRRPRRRYVLAALAASAAAAIAVQTMLPSGSPGAASPAAADALHRLASVASADRSAALLPSTYLHLVTSERQQESDPSQPNETRVRDTWISSVGDSYTRQVTTRAVGPPTVTTYHFPAGGDQTAKPSQAYLRELPTTASALNRYLRAHVERFDLEG